MVVSIRCKRRPAWISSSALVCLAWLGLALSVHSSPAQGSLFSPQEALVEDTESPAPLALRDYLPPLLVVVLRISFQIALAPYPWVYGNELFPLELRSYLCALTASLEPVQQFISCMLFPIFVEVRIGDNECKLTQLIHIQSISLSGTFLLYSMMAFMAVVFGASMLPETRGKTLEQINEMFYRERMVRCGSCRNREELKDTNNNPDMDGEIVLLMKK